VVKALAEHGTLPAEDPVHGSRQARADGLHAARKRSGVNRLDHQVRVVVHQRVVHEAKVSPVACAAEAALELADDLDRAERRDVRPELHGDMRGVAVRDAATAAVRHGMPRGRFATGAGSATTPAHAWREHQLELKGPVTHAHLNTAIFWSCQ
jgi:hypothetical protein